MAVNPKKLRPYDEPPRVRRPLVPSRPDSAATAFLVVAVLWLVVATGLGALWASMLSFPDQLRFTTEVQVPIIGALPIEISDATVFSAFMNALVFGWLSNAAFAAILFITPRITGTRLVGEQMAWGGMALWNLGVASIVVIAYLPALSTGGRLALLGVLVIGLLLLALLNVNAAFWRTVLASRERLPYVSIWFFGLALLAFMGAVALSAAGQAAAIFINLDATAVALVDAFGARLIATYWILGAALGTLFYIIPRATLNALSSGGMALAAWLLWAGLSGISGLGALIDTSVPFVVTSIGNVGTLLLVAPVFLAVGSLAMTMHGRWSMALSAGTVSFAVVSIAFLLASALLEAIGALRSVQGLVHGTEWMTGVMIFSAMGAATFAFFAFIDHAAPRMFRRDWADTVLTEAQLWAGFAGATLGGLALIGAGIAHGSLMRDGAPPDQLSGTLLWFRLVAAGGLGLTALGAVCVLGTLFLMYTTARRAEYALVDAAPAAGH
ncbi:MAG TPA: cbb3-type cytochrome c oxidase subunit I [Candidatus Limnocylindrales bacterium]|nr:cbb3-type cytochrome c oxidase subunit I [Candidatus Limnocylindrales bacterium]